MKHLLLSLAFCVPLPAATFSVIAAGGGDYTTVQACANAAGPGDTCLVSAGTYSETVTLSTTGTVGSPITFRGDSGGAKPVVTGGFLFTSLDYITIDGFELNNWVRCNPFTGSACNWIQVLNNDFEGVDVGIQLRANDVLISGNTFNNVTGDMVRQHGERWVIRNNTVIGESDGADVHMDFWQSFCSGGLAASYALIENNTLIDVSGANAHLALVNETSVCSHPPTNLIFRYNKVKNIGSLAIYIDTNDQAPGAERNVIYNNTFAELVEGSLASWQDFCCIVDASASSSGINNLFYDAVDVTGATGFAGGTGWAQSYNLYFDSGGAITFSGDASAEAGAVKNADPLFVNYASNNFTLHPTSPAVNAGGPLTTVAVADSGSGTELVVADAAFFQPGWGGASADWIRVGTTTTVQISSINYATNTVTLVSGISRSDGDAVYLYKNSSGEIVLFGALPDIGASEYANAVGQRGGTVTGGQQ